MTLVVVAILLTVTVVGGEVIVDVRVSITGEAVIVIVGASSVES